MTDRPPPAIALIAHCRAGFEPETAADLLRLAAIFDDRPVIDAPAGRGFVVARLREFHARRVLKAFERIAPIFARSIFVGTGPHALLDAAVATGRPDRIAPMIAEFERFCAGMPLHDLAPHAGRLRGFSSLRLETPDTNDGKELSGLARALAARLEAGLRAHGLMIAAGEDETTAAAANLHALFVDGAHVYVGASAVPWASPWPMGIPRLRKPGGAPSRSTSKLAEAFVTFLGDGEPDILRAGMRAVDLGAAPGGWTWQLAHRGLHVIAVDNGPLKGTVRDDPLVTHLRADGLSYVPKRPVDWMTCDIVEQPARIAALVARWIGEGHARHAIFNLKLPMKKRYDEVRRCESIITDALARARIESTLALRQLYHDREEVTGYVSRMTPHVRGRRSTTTRRG
ncbi:MAG: 23S rRNA (cytidine(2498)-2'-O)-methyltransferase RlmM [Betaproteobacteria bacterium]